jgi:transcriptional regulator with XRE-family HTH domain
VTESEVGRFLRSWRDRLAPAEVGVSSFSGRRTSGLRREEVAALAGISVDYLARLEQGRTGAPSVAVVSSLSRALRLSTLERDHLYLAAGHAPPALGQVDRHISPSVQRILDRLADTPVLVIDATWEVVTANRIATALLGSYEGTERQTNNLLWRHFCGPPTRVVYTVDENEAFERESVADLHRALVLFPKDSRLRDLVAGLQSQSGRFAKVWDEQPIAARTEGRKTIRHPDVGDVTLDCDVLTVADSNLRLVVYTARPGSTDETSLAMAAALGEQAF